MVLPNRPAKVIANAFSAGFVRREALLIRVEVRDHHRQTVAAVWQELRAACSGRRRYGWEQP
jgi:hypothetical protein